MCEDAFKSKQMNYTFCTQEIGISVLSDLLHIPRLPTCQVCNVIGAF